MSDGVNVAVIIVTWNVRAQVLDALASLYADLATSGLSYRVVVVDNASTDGTSAAVCAAFPQTEVIDAGENLGFVRGNNLALRRLGFADAASAEDETLPRAVYLLNPDTVTTVGATRTLYDALLGAADVGMVGARLTYGDGSFQHSAFGFPGLRQVWTEFYATPGRLIEGGFNGRYPRRLYAGGQPFDVDFVLGATMMVRREVVAAVGLLDEAFFMYCEEIDWAWRMRRADWRVQCVPAAHVIHLGGQSTGQVRPQSAVRLWTSRLYLYRKHQPAWKSTLARRLIAAGMRRRQREAALAGEAALAEAYAQISRLAQTNEETTA